MIKNPDGTFICTNGIDIDWPLYKRGLKLEFYKEDGKWVELNILHVFLEIPTKCRVVCYIDIFDYGVE